MSNQPEINDTEKPEAWNEWTPAEKRDIRSLILMALAIFGTIAATLVVVVVLSEIMA